MHTITFKQNNAATGEERTYQGQVEEGKTVWALGVELGLLSRSACGGRGICGKCRVQLNGSGAEPTAAQPVAPAAGSQELLRRGGGLHPGSHRSDRLVGTAGEHRHRPVPGGVDGPSIAAALRRHGKGRGAGAAGVDGGEVRRG